MSRNSILALIIVLLVIFAVVLFSRGNTNTQSGFVSPTPVEQSTTVTEAPAVEVSPTTEVTVSPAAVSPTVPVTVPPAQ
ncbi:MAG TPA: hypothetical protein VNA13_04350 [Xanthomonadales bacterium]|nr:hypothetical protein [Xanthomonadales bacterium]